MPSLKDVKTKIVGVGKTKQITRAMNMVASAKLRSAQTRIEKFRPYAQKYLEVIGDLASNAQKGIHPLLTPHDEIRTCAIVLITSDRGLCGGFNANIAAEGMRLAKEKQDQGIKPLFFCVGKKGRDAIRVAGFELAHSMSDRMANIDFMAAIEIGDTIVSEYLTNVVDEVYLVYGEFQSMAHQPPVRLKILPMNADTLEQEAPAGPKCEYIYEPSESKLLDDLLPRFINIEIYRGLLDTSASEHAARMAAMDNATRNCNELINTLTLLYNKTRQSSITSELIDIVGGAEALKG